MRALAVIVSLVVMVLAAVFLISGALGATLKPPRAPGDGAVLRVIAPTGKHYEVRWGGEWWQVWRERGDFVAEVDKGHWAKDHPVKPTGDGVYEFTVSKVARKGEDYEKSRSAWKGALSAILYVDGEVATCDSSQDAPLHVEWHKEDGVGHLLTRAWCSRYMRAESAPDHHPKGGLVVWFSIGGLLILPVLLLILFALAYGKQAEPMAEEPRRAEAEKKREDVRLAKNREEERKKEEGRREEAAHRVAAP